MKFLLAAYAPKQIVPVWGTSNYILHIPQPGTSRRTTQTPSIGGAHLNIDNIKKNVAKTLASKLRNHNKKGGGMAVI